MPAFPKPSILTSTAPGPGEDTCGQCRFTQIMPHDVTQVVCGGSPPSPVGTANGIVWARPSMPRSERACALFQRKPPVLDA